MKGQRQSKQPGRGRRRTVRVVIADDHPFLREMLAWFLTNDCRCRVVAEAGDGQEAVRASEAHQPDLLILDLKMPGMGGIEAMPLLRRAAPGMRILHYSGSVDDNTILTALQTRPDGFVQKTAPRATLREAVNAMADGERYFCARTARLFESLPQAQAGAAEQAGAPALSPREAAVLRAIAEDKSSKEIAELLGISVGTVGVHRANLLRKLRLRGAVALTRYAFERGLLPSA